MGKRVILAVAGSGKTYHICHQLDPEKKNLILAFTHANIYNITAEITKRFGRIPEKTSIRTFHSFVYQFLLKPYEFTVFYEYGVEYIDTRGVSLKQPPKPAEAYNGHWRSNPYYHSISDIHHFITQNNQYYCDLMTDLLIRVNKKNKLFLKNIFAKINEFYDAVYIDEFQDFREKDFEIIFKLIEYVDNILLVGDYYQHSVSGKNNTGKPFKVKHDIISYGNFINMLSQQGVTVDTETLKKSRRCSKNICEFIQNKLKIPIFSSELHDGKIIPVKDGDVKNILDDDKIIKLTYENSGIYSFVCKNWSYSKGDTYNSTCVILTENSKDIFQETWVDSLSGVTRNRLYVALTRSCGDVYLMTPQQLQSALSLG